MSCTTPSRRRFLHRLAAATAAALVAPRRAAAAPGDSPDAALAALERRSGGRLGFFALDTGSTRTLALRSEERFGLCSTFKLLLAAIVLREIEAGRLAPDTVLTYGASDMVPHAPVTERHLTEGGLPLLTLAEAAQVTSDNVAANLLIRHLGGPAAVTAQFRSLGDDTTRIDRFEPEMNRVPPGELRDTTTPRAMAQTLARLFDGTTLGPQASARLRQWMIATRTGLRRLRAGLPPDWVVGDKTGTGYSPSMPNKCNDIAMLWLADRAPVAVAAYYDAPGHFPRMRAEDDAVLAEAGALLARWIVG